MIESFALTFRFHLFVVKRFQAEVRIQFLKKTSIKKERLFSFMNLTLCIIFLFDRFDLICIFFLKFFNLQKNWMWEWDGDGECVMDLLQVFLVDDSQWHSMRRHQIFQFLFEILREFLERKVSANKTRAIIEIQTPLLCLEKVLLPSIQLRVHVECEGDLRVPSVFLHLLPSTAQRLHHVTLDSRNKKVFNHAS